MRDPTPNLLPKNPAPQPEAKTTTTTESATTIAQKLNPTANLRQHTFFTTIKEGKLASYKHYHDNIWPEVCKGLRAAGLHRLKTYRLPKVGGGGKLSPDASAEEIEASMSNNLVMIIETDRDLVDLGSVTGPGTKYREDPRYTSVQLVPDACSHSTCRMRRRFVDASKF